MLAAMPSDILRIARSAMPFVSGQYGLEQSQFKPMRSNSFAYSVKPSVYTHSGLT